MDHLFSNTGLNEMRYTTHTIIAIDSNDLADQINRMMQADTANRLHSCMFVRMKNDEYEYVTIFEIQDNNKNNPEQIF